MSKRRGPIRVVPPAKPTPPAAPAGPTPVKPTPVKPTPVKPVPVKPVPVKPVPVKPVPVKPAPVAPAPVKPVPVKPAPVKPAPVAPTPAKPVPAPASSSPSSACSLAQLDSSRPPGACWRPYSDQSPFNRIVPGGAPLAANSAAVVGRTVGFGPPQKLSGGVAGTGDDWNHPIYYSDSSDPLYTVHCINSSQWGACEVEGAKIHIPGPARAAGGADAHLAVIDKAAGMEYDFWQVLQKLSGGGTLTATYGGKTAIGGDGLGSQATAAGFGLAAGVIRPAELEAGNIDHALFMVVDCTNGTSVWPAVATSRRWQRAAARPAHRLDAPIPANRRWGSTSSSK